MEEGKINSAQENNEQLSQKEEARSKTIPVVHEQVHISKKTVEKGRVHIAKKVLEEEYNANIPVSSEEVVIEKKTINQYIDDAPPGIRLDGDTTIIPVLREVMVKRLLLVEEIYITKRKTETSVPAHEILRKEEIVITRTDSL